MRQWLCCGFIAALSLVSWRQPAASASIKASATLSSQQLGPDSYEYSLTLNNTGDTKISTFWFGWILNGPYTYDFLPSLPTSVSAPAGWQGAGVSDSLFGYYSVEWTSPTGLAAGGSLSGLVFDSPDPPSVINGQAWFGGFPVRQSWVYINGSQADPGYSFAATVPEPTSFLLLPLVMMLRRRNHHRNVAY